MRITLHQRRETFGPCTRAVHDDQRSKGGFLSDVISFEVQLPRDLLYLILFLTESAGLYAAVCLAVG